MQRAEKTFLDEIDLSGIPEELEETFQKMQELYILYNCAIREVNTKLENLNQEMEFIKERNPIQHIHYRLKKPKSVVKKLKKNGLEITEENIWNNIMDVAALRVICSYIDDIYSIADMLLMQDDVFLLKKKDYIKNPKESGYRSLHLIIEIPVFLSDEKRMVKVEIQIRTIAMDFWASLEHQIRYKSEIQIPDYIREKLRDSAENIYSIDTDMQQILKDIEELDK